MARIEHERLRQLAAGLKAEPGESIEMARELLWLRRRVLVGAITDDRDQVAQAVREACRLHLHSIDNGRKQTVTKALENHVSAALVPDARSVPRDATAEPTFMLALHPEDKPRIIGLIGDLKMARTDAEFHGAFGRRDVLVPRIEMLERLLETIYPEIKPL